MHLSSAQVVYVNSGFSGSHTLIQVLVARCSQSQRDVKWTKPGVVSLPRLYTPTQAGMAHNLGCICQLWARMAHNPGCELQLRLEWLTASQLAVQRVILSDEEQLGHGQAGASVSCTMGRLPVVWWENNGVDCVGFVRCWSAT